MSKFFTVFLLIGANIFGSSAFWSLDTDLQLGYEIYDKSYEINSVIQAIVTAATRNNVIQSDDKTKRAVNSLSAIANQLKSSPVLFFNELSSAASSRANSESWHINRIRSFHVNCNAALNVIMNVTGPLNDLNDVVNPYVVSALRTSLIRVQLDSNNVLVGAEGITRDVFRIRANSSLLLTPELISNFIDSDASKQLTTSLRGIRNSLAVFLLAIRDAGRLIVAHGSVHEVLSRSYTRDTGTRNSALNSFVNNYNRVRNSLLSSIATYRQAAETGIYSFVSRVQSSYDDAIVRRNFDQHQLPLIRNFGDVIVSKVYNQTFFQSSFDIMRDSIVGSFSNATDSLFAEGSEFRDAILDLQRTKFVRRYSPCLNELVAEAQEGSNSITSKYAFCLNERTSGIVVVIPSTSSWLSVIRDNINFILQQLNACLSGQTSAAGRAAISDCIQFNANNLAFYSAYLPITVESNLRPIVQGPPIIFQNCVRLIPTASLTKFDDVFAKCKAEVEDKTTTPTVDPTTSTRTTTTTTVEPFESTTEEQTTPDTETTPEESEYGSGQSELYDSYIQLN